ncbi:MAG: 3-hydroxyacyl-CoA dehydrogenase, partial [Chloroflexi bacterium]|nr:3-hydroxyacyl-CoA dehydrogenase [Chloroflexota bacterium]
VSLEYGPRRRQSANTLRALAGEKDLAARLRTLVSGGETENQVAWRILSQVLAYSADKVGEVADDIVSIDRAMRGGFNWSLGPFEMWDAIGLEWSVERMQSDGLRVPEWVSSLAESEEGFYVREGDATMQATPESTRTPVPD